MIARIRLELMDDLMKEVELFGVKGILSDVKHDRFLIGSPRIQPVDGEFQRMPREPWMDERQVALEDLEALLEAKIMSEDE